MASPGFAEGRSRSSFQKHRLGAPDEEHVDGRVRRSYALVEATAVELAREAGLSALTHQRIAERAGLSRSTIYRYWPTRDDLVLAAISGMPIPFATPPGERLADTLADGVRSMNTALGDTTSRRVALEVLAHAQEHPEVQTIVTEATDRLKDAIAHAVQTGEISRAPKPEQLLIDTLGPVLARLVFFGAQLTEREVSGTVNRALAATQ